MASAFQPEHMVPAGKPTQAVNTSFSAFDYLPSKIDRMDRRGGRGFLMDDYLYSGRVARRNDPEQPLQHLTSDTCKELIQYQKDATPWQVKQGLTETTFHTGFTRRQASSIPSAVLRSSEQVLRPGRRMMAVPPHHDVITGEGINRNVAHGERRHVQDHYAERSAGMYADAPGGRLRDSTARFFCTPEQLPHRPERQHTLETDGLVETKRTSTVIGVGINPSQEIFSVGAREALNDSLYGLQRRAAAKTRETAADAALVHALS